MTFPSFLGLIFAGVFTWFIYKKIRQSQRSKLYRKNIPSDYLVILKNNVPQYNRLPEKFKIRLHGLINLFLDKKEFVGCAGLEITDEIRLTIAGNASLLLLNQNKDDFSGFTSILVYPDTYVAKEISYDEGIETHHQSARAGESWHRGPIILSWSDVIRGINKSSDGHNVVIHEFAHKLDEENSIVDGLPILRDNTDYKEWAKILSREYKSLSIRVKHGTNTVLDEYGTKSPPEFFAVATESFFEKSKKMKKELPDLYEQLGKYYGLDPAKW